MRFLFVGRGIASFMRNALSKRLLRIVRSALGEDVTEKTLVTVLLSGFALTILLLLAAGITGVRNLRAIEETAGAVVDEFDSTIALVDELRREQAALELVLFRLTKEPELLDPGAVIRDLETASASLQDIIGRIDAVEASGFSQELQEATHRFTAEVRQALDTGGISTATFQTLFEQHQKVAAIVWQVMRLVGARAQAAEQALKLRSERLFRQTSALLGTCLVLALLSATLTLRLSSGLLQRMETQRAELNRISWQMLHNYEVAARRLSHELHDELGQILTAIKVNLVTGTNQPEERSGRIADAIKLVEEAVAHVREISQLLHPPILDDFGLPAALRWLADRFQERTGVRVEVETNLERRLSEETETHLFRIAQEALTNVSRHAQATRVRLQLQEDGSRLRLIIEDNGRGLPEPLPSDRGMGLVAMRARARTLGGSFRLVSRPGQGARVEVEAPLDMQNHGTGKEDPSPAGG